MTAELTILEHLATYRYLTAEQLHLLGVTKNKRYLYATLQGLSVANKRGARRRGAWVEQVRFFRGAGMQYVWHLSKEGAAVLRELGHEVEAPRPRVFENDARHRINTVWCHIWARIFAEQNGLPLRFFRTYFDGAQRVKAGGASLIPDAVFLLGERLYALEMYDDKDATRVERQLLAYIPVLREAAIEAQHDYERGIRVLCVFAHAPTERLARDRLARLDEFDAPSRVFLFTSLGELFANRWRRLNGDVVEIQETTATVGAAGAA